MITVIYGVLKCKIPFSGQTAKQLRNAVKGTLDVSEDTMLSVNGVPVLSDYVLERGDLLEFVDELRHDQKKALPG